MREIEHRRSRLAAWYERTARPGWVLAGVVVALYAASLPGDFVLDDLRALRVFEEYRQGQRPALDLYRFLRGGERNQAEREAGWYPWWVQDELRYQHLRPAAEWVLYAEYLVFGERALGYRVVGVALYALGAWLVLGIFRLVGGDERLARWAGLLFVVAAGHAIPVIFISQQCDVIALALAGGAMLLAGRYVRDGGSWRLLGAVALYGGGLFAKEAVLPMAVLPVCFWLVWRPAAGVGRRTAVCVGALVAVGLGWLVYYVAGGYGSNALLMLDPLHTPGAYLRALAGRVILLLSTWLIPVNPFLLRLHHEYGRCLPLYGAMGAILLVIVGQMYWRHHRRQRGVAAMSLWVLPFLPLLACTAPDDRVMLLPSIGFAYLGAAWLTRRRSDGSLRLRRVPLVWFGLVQAITVLLTTSILQFMEGEARQHLGLMAASFGREPKPGDHVFLLNTARSFETLFAQDRVGWVAGGKDLKVMVLSDAVAPTVDVVDERTLRLRAGRTPFFTSFVGLMGTSRGRPRREGDLVDVGEFVARISQVRGGEVEALELRFRRRLDCDSYRFFWSDPRREPVLWRPSAGAG